MSKRWPAHSHTSSLRIPRHRSRIRVRFENPDTDRVWKGFHSIRSIRSVRGALSACQSSLWQQLLQIKERRIFYAEAEINFCQSIAKKESDDVGNERDEFKCLASGHGSLHNWIKNLIFQLSRQTFLGSYAFRSGMANLIKEGPFDLADGAHYDVDTNP